MKIQLNLMENSFGANHFEARHLTFWPFWGQSGEGAEWAGGGAESGNAINVNACVPIAACQSQVESSRIKSSRAKFPFVFVFVLVFVHVGGICCCCCNDSLRIHDFDAESWNRGVSVGVDDIGVGAIGAGSSCN